jgi:hypothetical protein
VASVDTFGNVFRHGCDSRDRDLLIGRIRRPRRHLRLGDRHVHGQRGQRRERGLLVQVRRDGAGRQRAADQAGGRSPTSRGGQPPTRCSPRSRTRRAPKAQRRPWSIAGRRQVTGTSDRGPDASTGTPSRCTTRPRTEQLRRSSSWAGARCSTLPGRNCQLPAATRLDGDPGSDLLQRGADQGRKVFSAWPSEPRLQLTRTWRYRGRRQPAAGHLLLGRLARLRPASCRTLRSGAGRQHLHRHAVAGSTRAPARPTRPRPRPSALRAGR